MSWRRLISPARVTVVIGLLVLVTGFLEAGDIVIDPATGNVLTVESVYDPYDPLTQSIRLVSRSSSGQISTETIPSSFDQYADVDPVIALDPLGGVVVAWSRFDGSDFELAMVRRYPFGGWENHVILTLNTAQDVKPRMLVDQTGRAHILWWGNGAGGPVFLQSFDVFSKQPATGRHRPLEPPPKRASRMVSAGGQEDPGLPTLTGAASALPCDRNPSAAPNHGVVMSCGRPAAYQLSGCQLVVGTEDGPDGTWFQTLTSLEYMNLTNTSVREIVQTLADARCGQ